MIKLFLSILLLIPLCAVGQRQKRDPLSDLEVDKLRDAAQTPDVRLKLYIEFARTRLDHLQQAKADSKAADRDQQMQDALQDFIDIFDDDLRKALKPVIEADTEFGSKLRAFKSSLASSREEFAKYDYLVGTALQAVDDGAKDHRSLLAEQEEKFKNKKEKPHKERSSGG
jgi:hypothetical protein